MVFVQHLIKKIALDEAKVMDDRSEHRTTRQTSQTTILKRLLDTALFEHSANRTAFSSMNGMQADWKSATIK